jgi:hypothetical protein
VAEMAASMAMSQWRELPLAAIDKFDGSYSMVRRGEVRCMRNGGEGLEGTAH